MASLVFSYISDYYIIILVGLIHSATAPQILSVHVTVLHITRLVLAIHNHLVYVWFTTDSAPPPQILSARVSESDVCDDNGCVVTVEWSEPFISCAGSVSQYVLSVTPPTCDCPSPPNCVVMDGRAVYTLSGSERQHNITVNRTMSPEYGVTVRADTCDNTLTGEPSSEYNINLTGMQLYFMLVRLIIIILCSQCAFFQLKRESLNLLPTTICTV